MGTDAQVKSVRTLYGEIKIGGMYTQPPLIDGKDLLETFEGNDNLNPSSWEEVSLLKSGEKHSSIFNKISTMFKNIRFLYKMLGTTDISAIGNGTVTDAVSELNNAITNKIYTTPIIQYANKTIQEAVWHINSNILVDSQPIIARVRVETIHFIVIGLRINSTRGRYICLGQTNDNVYSVRINDAGYISCNINVDETAVVEYSG